MQPVVSSGAKRPASSSGLVARVESAGLGDKATGQLGKRVGGLSQAGTAVGIQTSSTILLITRTRKAIVSGQGALQSNVGYGLKQAVCGNVSPGVLAVVPAF